MGKGTCVMARQCRARRLELPGAEWPISAEIDALASLRRHRASPQRNPSSALACVGVATVRPARSAHAASASIIGPLPLARSPPGR